eukprot:2000072-Rhodomonas_salina.1
MSGTEIGHGATSARAATLLVHFILRCKDLVLGPMLLRRPYAISGTDLVYAATRSSRTSQVESAISYGLSGTDVQRRLVLKCSIGPYWRTEAGTDVDRSHCTMPLRYLPTQPLRRV